MTLSLKTPFLFCALMAVLATVSTASAQNRPVLVITDKVAAAPAAVNAAPYPAVSQTSPSTKEVSNSRPLVKIKFDAPNVDYEQAVYMAMSEAMKKNPKASYDMVAVTPLSGNAAQMAIESAHARRNAEGVLRSLSKMGLNINKIDLRAEQSATAQTNEVHILMR